MAENNRWNKKIFSLLLAEAKGVRSWRQFADDCGVSYVQMRKLALMTQENPPRPKLIRKVASHAFNDIDLEDLMFAAGMNQPDLKARRAIQKPVVSEQYMSLSTKDKRMADRFIEFLADSADASDD